MLMSILVIQVKYPGRLTLRWTLVHREFVAISLGISVYGGGMLIGLGKGGVELWGSPDPTGSAGTELSWVERRRLAPSPPDVGSVQEGGMTWVRALCLVKAHSRERLGCELSALLPASRGMEALFPFCFCLFIYFWRRWVFLAARGLLSSSGARVLSVVASPVGEHRLQGSRDQHLWCMGLVTRRHVIIFLD